MAEDPESINLPTDKSTVAVVSTKEILKEN